MFRIMPTTCMTGVFFGMTRRLVRLSGGHFPGACPDSGADRSNSASATRGDFMAALKLLAWSDRWSALGEPVHQVQKKTGVLPGVGGGEGQRTPGRTGHPGGVHPP